MSVAKRLIENDLDAVCGECGRDRVNGICETCDRSQKRRRKKYEIAGNTYSSTSAVQKKVFSIVEKYCGDRFSNLDPDASWIMDRYDTAFVGQVLSYHEEYEQIRGPGIAVVKVCYIPKGRPHYGMAVVRVDGTERIVGVRNLGSTKAMLSKKRFREACRHAIKGQTIEYKEMYFDGHQEAPSEISGKLISQFECEVDHMPPTFDDLVRQFFGDQEAETFDDGLCWRIMDNELRRRWAEFHREHAKLRCISKLEHHALKG